MVTQLANYTEPNLFQTALPSPRVFPPLPFLACLFAFPLTCNQPRTKLFNATVPGKRKPVQGETVLLTFDTLLDTSRSGFRLKKKKFKK